MPTLPSAASLDPSSTPSALCPAGAEAFRDSLRFLANHFPALRPGTIMNPDGRPQFRLPLTDTGLAAAAVPLWLPAASAYQSSPLPPAARTFRDDAVPPLLAAAVLPRTAPIKFLVSTAITYLVVAGLFTVLVVSLLVFQHVRLSSQKSVPTNDASYTDLLHGTPNPHQRRATAMSFLYKVPQLARPRLAAPSTGSVVALPRCGDHRGPSPVLSFLFVCLFVCLFSFVHM